MCNKKATDENRKAGIDALIALQDRLYGVVYVLTGGSEDVLDVLQNANAAIMKHIDEFDPSRPAWPWFKAFAVNQVLLWRTEAKRSRVSFNSETIRQLAETLTEESFAERKPDIDYLRLLRACMQKLAPEDREILEERYYRMTSVADIASRLHVSYVSLRKLMQRLRDALRNCIGKKMAGQDAEALEDGEETDSVFSSAMESVFDGLADDDSRAAFLHGVENSPENLRAFARQALMHAYLECRRNAVFAQEISKEDVKPVFRITPRVVSIAATLALLAAGIAGWHSWERNAADGKAVRVEKWHPAASAESATGEERQTKPVVAAQATESFPIAAAARQSKRDQFADGETVRTEKRLPAALEESPTAPADTVENAGTRQPSQQLTVVSEQKKQTAASPRQDKENTMSSKSRAMVKNVAVAAAAALVSAGTATQARANVSSVALDAAYTVDSREWARHTLILTNNETVTSTSISFNGYPSELGTPLFWLDASDTNGWEITTESSGVKRVTKIPSKTGDGRYLFFQPGIVTNGPTLRENDPELCGGSTVDFGAFKSKLGLWFNDNGFGTNKLDNIGSIAALWGSQCGGGWLLGGGYGWNEASVTSPYIDSGFLCHRGGNPYLNSNIDDTVVYANAIVKDPALKAIVCGLAWLDGSLILPSVNGFSANYQTLTYVFTNNHANTFGIGINDSRGGRTGGQRVSEMIFYDHVLTDAERQKLDAYLARKWFQREYDGFNGHESLAKIQEKNLSCGQNVIMGVHVPAGETLNVKQIVGGRNAGTFTKNGEGTLSTASSGDYAGTFNLNGGILHFEHHSIPTALPTNSLIHLDASLTATMTLVKENGTNFIKEWKDVEGRTFCERPLLAYAPADYARPTLMTNALNGFPIVDFGAFTGNSTSSGRYMCFTNSLPGAVTVLWVVGAQNGGGSLLGCTSLDRHGSGGAGFNYPSPFFEQGGTIQSAYPYPSLTNGLTFIDGIKAEETKGFPTSGYHVIARRCPGCEAIYYLAARDDGNYRGGQRLAELVVYNRVLTDRELDDAQAFLMKKWFKTGTPGYMDGETADIQALTVSKGFTGTIESDTNVYVGTLSGSGTLNKTGAGNMMVQQASSFGGTLNLLAGGIGAKEPDVETVSPAASPAFHLDATRMDSFTFEPQGGTNFIAAWHDTDGGWKNAAKKYDSKTGRPLPWLRTDDPANGHPVVDFGKRCSCRTLVFEQPVNNIRSAYVIIGTQDGSGGFLLGSSGSYGNNFDFHRNPDIATNDSPSLALFYLHPFTVFQGDIYTNGVKVDYTVGLNGGYELVEVHTLRGAHASALAGDRYDGRTDVMSTTAEGVYRTGGQRLGEVLLYDRVLTARERVATRNYLMAKWLGREPKALPDENASLNIPYVSASDGTGIVAERPVTIASLIGTGSVNITGGALVSVNDISAHTGLVSVTSGTLALSALPSPNLPAEIITDGLAFWADATWGVGLTNGTSVLAWTNRMQNGWTAYANDILPTMETCGLNGLPVIDLGTLGSRKTLKFRDAEGSYVHLSGIKSIFWVFGSQAGGGFVLGGGTNYANSAQHYNFHRGQNLAGEAFTKDAYIISVNADAVVRAGIWQKNGRRINAMATALSGNYDLLSLVMNSGYTDAEGFAFDGRVWNARTGGQKLAEVLIYTNALTEVQRLQVEKYLNTKWGLHVYQQNTESKAEIELASGTSLSLGGVTQNVASVTGSGIISNGVLHTLGGVSAGADNAAGTLTLDAGLVMNDGNVWTIDVTKTNADCIAVGGAVTFGKNMSVVLRGVDEIKAKLGTGYQQKVMSAASYANTGDLASAKYSGVPKGYSARLVMNGTNVMLRISRNGFVIMLK